jgi:hypothetical protein
MEKWINPDDPSSYIFFEILLGVAFLGPNSKTGVLLMPRDLQIATYVNPTDLSIPDDSGEPTRIAHIEKVIDKTSGVKPADEQTDFTASAVTDVITYRGPNAEQSVLFFPTVVSNNKSPDDTKIDVTKYTDDGSGNMTVPPDNSDPDPYVIIPIDVSSPFLKIPQDANGNAKPVMMGPLWNMKNAAGSPCFVLTIERQDALCYEVWLSVNGTDLAHASNTYPAGWETNSFANDYVGTPFDQLAFDDANDPCVPGVDDPNYEFGSWDGSPIDDMNALDAPPEGLWRQALQNGGDDPPDAEPPKKTCLDKTYLVGPEANTRDWVFFPGTYDYSGERLYYKIGDFSGLPLKDQPAHWMLPGALDAALSSRPPSAEIFGTDGGFIGLASLVWTGPQGWLSAEDWVIDLVKLKKDMAASGTPLDLSTLAVHVKTTMLDNEANQYQGWATPTLDTTITLKAYGVSNSPDANGSPIENRTRLCYVTPGNGAPDGSPTVDAWGNTIAPLYLICQSTKTGLTVDPRWTQTQSGGMEAGLNFDFFLHKPAADS